MQAFCVYIENQFLCTAVVIQYMKSKYHWLDKELPCVVTYILAELLPLASYLQKHAFLARDSLANLCR